MCKFVIIYPYNNRLTGVSLTTLNAIAFVKKRIKKDLFISKHILIEYGKGKIKNHKIIHSETVTSR